MRTALLEHLDDMLRAAALRGDENAVAIVNQMKRMGERLPTYFETALGEQLPDDPALRTSQPGRVGSFDSSSAMQAANQETQARAAGDEAGVTRAWGGQFHTDPARILESQPLDKDRVAGFNKAHQEELARQEEVPMHDNDNDANREEIPMQFSVPIADPLNPNDPSRQLRNNETLFTPDPSV